MEVIEDFLTLDEIISKTEGKYPLFIKITNGDNTGYDAEHPDMYRFDYASPVLSQIEGHEAEAFSTDKENLGVNIFVTTVMRSRNFDIKKWSCIKGDPNSKLTLIIRLPDKTEVSTGAITFDWTLFKLFEMLGKTCSKITGNVLIYGKFGGDLPTKFAQLIPSNIKGDLLFVNSSHNGTISPDVISVEGGVKATGLQFSGWSPSLLGDDGKLVVFDDCKSMPNLSSCKIKGGLAIRSCMIDNSALPKDVEGSMVILNCNLGKVKTLPSVTKDCTIAADSSFSIDDLTEKPKIGGNLILSKALFVSGTLTEEKVKEKFDVAGEIRQVDDDKIMKDIDNLINGGFVVGQSNQTLGKWASAGVEFVDQSFGLIGHAAMEGLYKLFNKGKKMPPKGRTN